MTNNNNNNWNETWEMEAAKSFPEMKELFGRMVVSRGITIHSSLVDIVSALVDVTREAKSEWASVAGEIIEDFVDGMYSDYLDVLTVNVGIYTDRNDGLVRVPLLPHIKVDD